MKEILEFLKTNKDAVTSFGILITFLISAISLYMSIRNNKAVHYVNSITKSRIDWINQLRNTISDFIANTNIHNNVYYKNDYERTGLHLSSCQKLCSEIRLLLNCCDERDKEIVELSNKILKAYSNYCDEVHNCKVDNEGYFVSSDNMKEYISDVEKNIEELSKKVQIYLKSEWNRVKYESVGKIYEKDTIDFDYEELMKRFEQPTYRSNAWKRFYINYLAMTKRNLLSPEFIMMVLVTVTIILLIA